MTASLLPADDTPGVPGADAGPRLPKYYQVKRQLLELTAALDAGSPVPPERELARSVRDLADYGQAGARRARHRGPAAAHAGQGHLRGQAQGGPAAGAGQLHRRHARARPAPADQDPRHRHVATDEPLAELLGIRPGGRALRIHRLRLADGERSRSTPRTCPPGASPASATTRGHGRCTRP